MRVVCISIIVILSVVSSHASSIYIGSSGGKEYYLSSFGTQASQAAESCKSSGMIIASPSTQTEYDDLVRLYVSTSLQHAKAGRAYIGISKIRGQWSNSQTGHAVDFSITWTPPNPSGDGLCSEIIREEGYLGLNDLSCGHTRHFICEKNVPITTTSAPVTSPGCTHAPVTECSSQCVIEKTELNSVISGKMAVIEELLKQNQQQAAKIQRLEMINKIELRVSNDNNVANY